MALPLSSSSPISSLSSWRHHHRCQPTVPSNLSLPHHHLPRPSTKPSPISLHVSLEETSIISHSPDPKENPSPEPRKSSIWINPNSTRAPLLQNHSMDARFTRLASLAAALDSRVSAAESVPVALASFAIRGGLTEQDAVVVLNGMNNPDNAMNALRWFLSEIHQLNSPVILYNVTFKVLRKQRNWGLVVSLWDEMLQNGVKPDNITFSTIISCARICNLPAKAVEWFEKMTDFSCSPDAVTYSAMIDAYGRSGNSDMALGLYDRARKEKWRLDAVTFATVIRVHSNAGNFDGAVNVFEEMKALGVKPNVVIYNTLLDAMGRAGRPWRVKAIHREMMAKGLSPNMSTYAALLRSYSKARYAEDALGIYRQVKEKGMRLSVVLYNMLLSMCADIGFVDEAEAIFQEMRALSDHSIQPDSWSYSSLITAFCCSGKLKEAEAILSEMLEAGFQPNIFVLTSLIQCYGKAGLTDDVIRSFNMLPELGIIPDDRFCGCLLNVATRTPREELPKVIDCIKRSNERLGSLVMLLMNEVAPVDAIKESTEEMLSCVDVVVKKAYCNCLIDLCVNLRQMNRASILLDLAINLQIYTNLQTKSSTQWSLHVKGLSLGAAISALHLWIKDLNMAIHSGEELPPGLGINTGHGKHKYSAKGLASMFVSHLREMSSPFHEAPDNAGWFLTTSVAAKSWLETMSWPDSATA